MATFFESETAYQYHNPEIIDRLKRGNQAFLSQDASLVDVSPALRKETAEHGQHPYAVVITCSDSRVNPEAVFSAGLGELFVIRVAGNVMLEGELGSVQYAAAHLGCKVILVLGHTNCGAVDAALHGGGTGYTRFLTDEILKAIGGEDDESGGKDPLEASKRNILHSVETICEKLSGGPDALSPDTDVVGALYHLADGRVEWLES